MTLDLDAILPWDFTISLNGVDYQTRPPSIGELSQLRSIGSMTPAQQADLLDALLRDGSAEHWSYHHVVAALLGLCEYFKGWAEKNSPAVAARVTAAMRMESHAPITARLSSPKSNHPESSTSSSPSSPPASAATTGQL